MRPWLRLCEATLNALATLRARQDRTVAGRRKTLGNAGERQAYFHLRRAGHIVVARQWSVPQIKGELDLIAWDGETLCFVEVKTRSVRDRFAPERAIGQTKEEAMRRTARAYMRGLFPESQDLPLIRFDVVTVLRLKQGWRVQLQPGTAFQPEF